VGVEVVLRREGVSELVVSKWHISTIRQYSDIHVGRSGEPKAKENLKIQTTIHTLITTQKSKQRKTQQNKTTLVQSPFATLSQETSWAYSTTSRVHTG